MITKGVLNMNSNLIYLYPNAVTVKRNAAKNRHFLRSLVRYTAKTIDIFASVGILFCVLVGTLLLMTML